MKNLFKPFLSVLCACLIGAAFSACKPNGVAVTGVKLNKAVLSLTVGETYELEASVLPDTATEKKVTWTSSDSAVAKVENGTVSALKTGSATVTVKTNDGGKTATCAVTVTAAKLTEEQWNKAVADTISAENFTLKVIQQMGSEKYETEAKFDKAGGKMWSKNEPSVSWSERYIVKTQNEVSDYTLDKESGMWNVSSVQAEDFNDMFASWEGIGDGVKGTTVDLIPTAKYNDITFESGIYSFNITMEETPLAYKVTAEGGYLVCIEMQMEVEIDDDGNKGAVMISFEFSDFGNTNISVPADLPQA